MNKHKPIILLDGDTLVYRSCCVSETEIHWSEYLHTLHSDPTQAVYNLDSAISHIEQRLNADKTIVALTDSVSNWRKKVLPTYKANRNNTRKPLAMSDVRSHILDKFETFLKPGLEADDVLGILVTHKSLVKGYKLIVSIDKDFKSVPCNLYNDRHPERGIETFSESQADHWFMMQTLMGDVVDGYSGITNVGPKRAEKILEPGTNLSEWWSLVVSAYERAGKTSDDALTQARVARICRACDYDFKKQEVILWTPATTR